VPLSVVQSVDGDDDHDRKTAGDDSIFNCCRAGLIRKKLPSRL